MRDKSNFCLIPLLCCLLSFISIAQVDSLQSADNLTIRTYILNNNLDSATLYLEKYKKVYNKTVEDSIFYVYQKALINRENGLYEKATIALQEILKHYENNVNLEMQVKVILDLAITYDQSGNHDISKFWNQIGIERLKADYNPKTHVTFLMNIANNYVVCMEDSALFYYHKALDIAHNNNIPSNPSIIYNIGTIYYLQDNYKEAIRYYKDSYNTRMKLNDSTGIVYPAIELALCYLLENDLQRSLYWLTISRHAGKNLESKKRYFEVKAEYHRQRGQFDLYDESIREYVSLYKQILNDKQMLKTQELNEKYHSDEQAEQIKKQKLQLEINRNKIELADKAIALKNGLIRSISLALALLIILILFIRQRTKRIKKENEVKLLEAKIEGESEARMLIGKNMHDFVLSDLHAIRFQLEGLQYLEQIPKDTLKRVTEALRLNTKELRTISHELSFQTVHEEILDFKKNLEQNLKILIGATEARIVLSYDNNIDRLALPKETKMALIAVMKEAITNAVKHAECKKIDVSLEKINESILV